MITVAEGMHSRVLHSGVSQTLARVRQEYWIPCGRAVIKKLIRNCGVCRRTEGEPYLMPSMPHLPKERVARSHPFEYTGIDYFGPLYVKEFPKATGEIVERKVWVCLFTCDMSTEEFLLCLRRFVARRGIPRLIISDNAQQFKAARTVLTKAWRDVVTDERQDIQWKFIIEFAPWMGGFYERLVGLTKRSRLALRDDIT